ncbi:MAG: ABC transporter permease [Acidobacteriia bacterium]|nr:ABC transporter permease [Terriglobia bacterium]
MTSNFESFVARRYLRAHRKEKVISVITVISVVGVAAGVMALVIALAVTNGLRNTTQRNLLGAMAHINVLEKEPGQGLENWQAMAARLSRIPHVLAVSPALYEPSYIAGPLQSKGVYLKGVSLQAELATSDTLRHLKSGSVERLRNPAASPPGIILGTRFVEDTGMVVGSNVDLIVSDLTPLGPVPSRRRFKVAGTFETGFFEIDDNWAYAPLAAVQRAYSLPDVINQLELKVDDVNRADIIAKDIERAISSRYTTTTWMERYKQLFTALRMERLVAIITIGLIELVAALNIFIVLVMMVMEKYRDIAVLMSMGARRRQIRRIFMLQGVLIGVAGSAIGLAAGYALCHFAERYHWFSLDETIYSMSFVPFETRWTDGIWIAAAAILVSFLATVYPAQRATRITPAEVLRYE